MSGAELSIDFETASLADLRRTGVHPYSRHESTRVLCMAYAFDDQPVQLWRLGQTFPSDVLAHVRAGKRVNAWNASFEWHIWNNTLVGQAGLDPDFDTLSLNQLYDTMASAAYWGLPLSLDAAAPAAGLSIVKDKDGHRLMLQLCKPRKWDKQTGATTWWHEDDPDKFDRLCEYCMNDVATERAVKGAILDLPAAERAVWLLDQRINARGVGVDYVLVERLKNLALAAADQGSSEIRRLTGGAVYAVTSNGALQRWLNANGYPEDNIRRATVEARLDAPGCKGVERAVLELRADIARTSAAKLNAMLDACEVRGNIGTVHGMLQYYGASRTGRWAGRLIQLQNMPRGVIKNTKGAIKTILGGAPIEMIEALYGPPMGVVSSCLRGCIVAPQGEELVVADFSQIEARVLPWMAGEEKVLDVFRSGGDVYVQAAAGIYGRTFPAGHKYHKSDLSSDERQIGKVAILALGFGGGKGAFQTMAANYGVEVSDERAEEIKNAWRQDNAKIVAFWWDLDRAARTVLADPKQIVDVGPLRIGMLGPHMVMVLPSKRALVYRDARIMSNKDRPGTFDITYMGTNQYSRKWERLRTYGGKLAENATQAVARDVMADTMLRADKAGHKIILTVHDELLTNAPAGQEDARLEHLIGLMRTPPAWADGLPTDGDGWAGGRYRK